MEQRFNPIRFYPPDYNSKLSKSYQNPNKRVEYLNILFYVQLIVFYGNCWWISISVIGCYIVILFWLLSSPLYKSTVLFLWNLDVFSLASNINSSNYIRIYVVMAKTNGFRL